MHAISQCSSIKTVCSIPFAVYLPLPSSYRLNWNIHVSVKKLGKSLNTNYRDESFAQIILCHKLSKHLIQTFYLNLRRETHCI